GPAGARPRSRGPSALATSLPRRFCSARRASTSVTRRRRTASASSSRSTSPAAPGPRLARAVLTPSGSSRTSLRSSMGPGYRTGEAGSGLVAPMAMAMAVRSSSERGGAGGAPRTGLGGGGVVGAHGQCYGRPLLLREVVVGAAAPDRLGVGAGLGAAVEGRQDHP